MPRAEADNGFDMDSTRSGTHRHPGHAMYDQLEDALASISMQLRSAIEADAGLRTPPGGANGGFDRAGGWARQKSAELASVLLDKLGLAATIEWHLRQFQKCTGIVCDLTVNDASGFDLAEDDALAVFDIYNQALSNVARHAGASRVAVVLTITPQTVSMAVGDNGVGFCNEARASGAGGLAAIQACSHAHHGTCEVASARSGGTTVKVSLPIRRQWSGR